MEKTIQDFYDKGYVLKSANSETQNEIRLTLEKPYAGQKIEIEIVVALVLDVPVLKIEEEYGISEEGSYNWITFKSSSLDNAEIIAESLR